MKIKFAIIMYKLQVEYSTCIKDFGKEFSSANLLSYCVSSFNPEILYVGFLSSYLSLNIKDENICFLCVNDIGENDIKENISQYPNLVLINDNIDIGTVFNRTINTFFQIDNWNNNMQKAIYKNAGLQALIDMSEEVLGEHIDILDENFKLLAYTKNISTVDPMTNELIEQGAHSKEVIEKFYCERIFEEFEQSNDLIVVDDSDLTEMKTVIKVLHINQCREMFVVLLLENHEATLGYLDLFNIFLNNVEQYCVKAFYSTDEYGDLYNLISDLLEKKNITEGEAASRLAFINYPKKDSFLCMTVKFEDENNVLINRFINIINKNLYSCLAFSYKKKVVIFHFCENDKDNTLDICERLKGVFFPLKYYIGISNVFEHIWEVPLAYEQTEAVLECATKIATKHPDNEDAPVYNFEDYFIEIFMFKGGIGNEIFKNSFMHKSMQLLENANIDKGVDLINLLDVYFNNSCKATDTGIALNMHRNSVLYHISKVEKLLGQSIENPQISLKLRLAIIVQKTGFLL